MASNEQPRFSTSTWPGVRLPVPPVWVYPVEMRDGLLVFTQFEEVEDNQRGLGIRVVRQRVPLPEELYLRELPDLDLKDEQSILGFARQYGPLGNHLRPGEDLALSVVAAALPSEALTLPEVQADGRHAFAQKVDSFRLHAQSIRDGVRLWSWYTAQLGRDDVLETWELPVPAPRDTDQAIGLLAQIVNAGLAPFHAHIEVTALHGGHDPLIECSGPVAGLYSALCLQFFNHVSEEAIYARCQNEACRRLFVRQRGRAQHGQYRTRSVLYCSNYCARAQGQRELRRRKARGNRPMGGEKS